MKKSEVKTKLKLPPFRLRFGAGFIAMMAVMYFFDTEGLIAAFLPAVVVHELGHMAVLIALGSPPRRLDADLTGFKMDYYGQLSPRGELLSALAGPLAGLLFAWLCAFFGSRFESRFLLLSAGTGLAINAFNLLPARPLDGGRALSVVLHRFFGEAPAKRTMLILGVAVSLGLIALGAVFLARGMGAAMIPAGAWLLILQKKEHL